MNPEIEELLKAIRVETAQPQDVPDIVRLARFSKLEIANIEKEKIEAGFLIYALDKEGYANRLNDYFYIAKGLGIDGFLMCYNRSFLEQLVSSGRIDHQDGVMSFLQNLKKDNDFMFGDQICLAPNMRQLGIGKKMMAKLFSDMETDGINELFVTVLNQPVQNEASRHFCLSLGGTQAGSATNSDRLTWDIYKFEAQKSLNIIQQS